MVVKKTWQKQPVQNQQQEGKGEEEKILKNFWKLFLKRFLHYVQTQQEVGEEIPKIKGSKMSVIPDFYLLSTKTCTLVWNNHLWKFQMSGTMIRVSEFSESDSIYEDMIPLHIYFQILNDYMLRPYIQWNM